MKKSQISLSSDPNFPPKRDEYKEDILIEFEEPRKSFPLWSASVFGYYNSDSFEELRKRIIKILQQELSKLKKMKEK